MSRTGSVLIVLILLVGATLRIYGLGAQSLGMDELASWNQSHVSTLTEVITYGVRPDVHPPGYQVLLYYVERYLGDGEVALRLPSMLAGVAAILAIYLLATRLYSHREGLMAAALMAVSWTPLAMSQNARAYSLVLLFSVVTFHLWYQLLRTLQAEQTPRLATQAGYVLCAAAICYLHYFGLLFIALQGAAISVYLVRRPTSLLRAGALYVLVALSYLPWLPAMLEHLSRPQGWIGRPTLSEALSQLASLAVPGYQPIRVLVAILLLAAAVRALLRMRDGRNLSPAAIMSSSTTLVLGWALLPFTIAYLKSAMSTPVLTAQNLIISLPALYLLMARASLQVFPGAALQNGTAMALVIAISWSVVGYDGYYSKPRDTQFREAAKVVAAHASSGDEDTRIVASTWGVPFFDYYLGKLGSSHRVDLLASEDADIERLTRFLHEKNPRQVWLLVGHRTPTAGLLQCFDQLYERISHHTFKDASATLYQQRR